MTSPTEQERIIPTIIVRAVSDRIGVVTAGEGDEEALVVFRGPEDARAYREQTGQHTADEGYRLISVDHEAIAALLEVHGLRHVHMPERWVGGDAPVDSFTAENFIRFLEESVA